ncbi:MAG: helix-turn-helix domain-containing protein [Cyanobacteria bacterium P01_H01_bin.15]
MTSTDKQQSTYKTWCTKHEAAEILGVSVTTVRRMRQKNQLIEGIHWTQYSSRCIRYNVRLLEDWAATRADAQSHSRAIDNFLGSLPSNQNKRSGRKPKKRQ